MLRTRQYVKLYRKYNSWHLNQGPSTWDTAQRAYNKLERIKRYKCILEWRRLNNAKTSVSNLW